MNKEELVQLFHKLDRRLFINNEFKDFAHADRPLPLDFGQTISQPSLVLMMTEQLSLDKHCKVLEIGTGSGY